MSPLLSDASYDVPPCAIFSTVNYGSVLERCVVLKVEYFRSCFERRQFPVVSCKLDSCIYDGIQIVRFATPGFLIEGLLSVFSMQIFCTADFRNLPLNVG